LLSGAPGIGLIFTIAMDGDGAGDGVGDGDGAAVGPAVKLAVVGLAVGAAAVAQPPTATMKATTATRRGVPVASLIRSYVVAVISCQVGPRISGP
jgi:hypothetical protein